MQFRFWVGKLFLEVMEVVEVMVMLVVEVLPVIFLQSRLISWRARLYASNKLSRFVLLLIKIEAVARVVLTFHNPTLPINNRTLSHVRILFNVVGWWLGYHREIKKMPLGLDFAS